ncbi:hypothetical protein [Ectothiorhodospira shaposhnikovii]|uniref:hypothetical protein n=1 Tax=Ectothiorhodospira shaposhnikovii TaxID=1054 RepID=UPI001EE789B6|nr:hypothetical protein [Ectothiorhodospira shaposhnikovii]MCG5513752.1 hypothetical protein [Ectothiorhodospira shaposhnikovii]
MQAQNFEPPAKVREIKSAMVKLSTPNEGPIFWLRDSNDLYRKLIFESNRLEQGFEIYDAFNFFVTAWHLYHDWKKSDDPKCQSRTKRDWNKLPMQMKIVLGVVRDIVNGSKHFRLDEKAAKKRIVDEVHSGMESNWYSYFFHEDLPGVTVDEQWYFSVRVLRTFVMEYFKWVFDANTSHMNFPPSLLEAIDYCNIANRPAGQPPILWGQ